MGEEIKEIDEIARELRAKLELMAASGLNECLVRRRSLKDVYAEIRGCGRCALATERISVSTGTGSAKSGLFIVLERPFTGTGSGNGTDAYTGEEGVLLKDIITKGLKVDTSDVYLSFVVRCLNVKSAADSDAAFKDESSGAVDSCLPYLFEEIEALKPKAVLLFGDEVAETFLGAAIGLAPGSVKRNRFYKFKGMEVVSTYTLGEILKDKVKKSEFWSGAFRTGKIV